MMTCTHDGNAGRRAASTNARQQDELVETADAVTSVITGGAYASLHGRCCLRAMSYRLLADAVLLLHLAFVVWAAAGGLLVWRRPRWAWLHLPALAWGAYVLLAGKPCPLTPLENHLRALGGEAGYGGSFIEHYLLALIYPDWAQAASGRVWQIAIAVGVLAVNALGYAAAWRRRGASRPAGQRASRLGS